jgi:long-chain acyl-CoA synthetase
VTPPTDSRDIPQLLRWYEEAPAATSGLPAFTFYRGDRRCMRIDYAELVARVRRSAAALAERHGVKRGDRVAMLMPNDKHTVVVLLAILSLGAVAVPLNPGLDPADWVFAATDCGAAGVVVTEALRPLSEPLTRAVSFVSSDAELVAHEAGAALACDGGFANLPAVILYTSGTTGLPKGVVLSHANLLANGRAMAGHFGLHADAQLAVMPLYHAHALGFGLMSALVSLGHLVLADRMNAFHWTDIITVERVQVTSLVPPLIPLLLKLRVNAAQVPSLKAVLVSSAPLSQQLARQFIEHTGIPLVQGWGLSEFTNFATCSDIDGGLAGSRRQLVGYPWPSIGRPLPGVDVEIRSVDGAPEPAGVKGELFVRGASRMLGYFHAGAATGASAGDWLATGDEGYFGCDERGPLYFITGRIKDLIIRDAEKVSPLTVERYLLDTEPQLLGRLAVVGFPHTTHGEEIGAYVEAAEVDPELTVRLLRRAQMLANGLRPKIVLFGSHAIPRTHTGKVQRARLKDLFASYASCSGPTRLERAP